jgi:hypothetical protein
VVGPHDLSPLIGIPFVGVGLTDVVEVVVTVTELDEVDVEVTITELVDVAVMMTKVDDTSIDPHFPYAPWHPAAQ